MDIAKIRKKLKESEADEQRPQSTGQTTAKPEENAPLEPKTEEVPGEPSPAVQPCEPEINNHMKQPGEKEQATDTIKEPLQERVAANEKEQPDEVIEILSFSLMKQEFAFRISQLAEILRYQWITTVPQIPPYVLGVTSLRGKVIPVIDLKTKLTLTEPDSDRDKKSKILIIKGPQGPIGVTVDRVIGVVRLGKSDILPPPSHLSEAELKFIEGVAVVGKRFVSIINMDEAVALHLK